MDGIIRRVEPLAVYFNSSSCANYGTRDSRSRDGVATVRLARSDLDRILLHRGSSHDKRREGENDAVKTAEMLDLHYSLVSFADFLKSLDGCRVQTNRRV